MKTIKKDWNEEKIKSSVNELLDNFDEGELFVEEVYSENIFFDDNKIKNASYDQDKGFGLRTVNNDSVNFAHNTELSDEAFSKAMKSVKEQQKLNPNPPKFKKLKSNLSLYTNENPIDKVTLTQKINFLNKVNTFAREIDERVKEVSVSLNGNHQNIEVITKNGDIFYDSRPLVRMNINITIQKKNKVETGSFGMGGRYLYDELLNESNWKNGVKKAYEQAIVKLSAKETPAGEQIVILGPGWPGILLHEAIGHGLEGDFNRKKTSAFFDLVGNKIASDQVSVVDDGTINKRRGSLTIDDEGTPSQNTMLIENGILKGFMHDRLNAGLMNQSPTGNGRRQSYSHLPMPRMTNTYMLNGKYEHDELIKSTKKGIYASQFSGGQVDITSGKFVFSASEAYEIIDGKICSPLKGATLIGNGPEILKEVTMVANNLKLDDGIGTCGKEGQSVPVGVGQPSLKVRNLTVGGTI